ncbi:dynamin family protein [Archangium violaceum]|uniref:dynamin family protein n=1 Tax=Archangium violaceum TaxID=83451 RepID=UPI00193BCDD5|nr:dynamin family protein [Archangium violaceum]QRK05276.1 dynamin family protein [Archangium violaceum]
MNARNTLESLLADGELARLVDQYGGGKAGEAAQRYALFRDRLGLRRFVVPVAGIQGTGKSTFLNAIAFGRPVLPIDADETTCVPVEIRHAREPAMEAVIHFQDGRTERVPADEESLGRFVHNGNNPGNQLGVSKVVLESDRPLLESGLVLVDLPGVGSLTAANLETTRRYLEESAGVLFMLRTTPPITRSESLFVTTWWARLPTAFFVQNWWTDEPAEEAADGREHNQKVLQGIIERNRLAVPMPSIHLVNAYRALEGSLKQDAALLDAAGLPPLLDVLARTAHTWPERIRADIGATLRADMAYALEMAHERLKSLSGDRATVEARMKQQQEQFDVYFTQLKARLSEARGDMEETLATIRQDISTWSRNAAAELRNNMRTKLRAGIVDGHRLVRALQDEQSVQADELFEKVQTHLLVLQDKLGERFAGLHAWRGQKFSGRFTVDQEERTRYENVLPQGGGALSALGGAALGAKIGAAGGPVGVAVGTIIGGALGFFFGSWAGGKARKAATESRASNVEPEVFAAIDRFIAEASRDTLAQVRGFSDHVETFLNQWMQEQRQRFDADREQVFADLRTEKDERARQHGRVAADCSALEKYLAQFPEVRS